MRWSKAIIPILILNLTLLPSMGCSNVEVNDLALIMALALDQAEDGGIEVSILQVNIHAANGEQGEGGGTKGGSNFIVQSAKGINLSDAVANLERKLSNKLFWGHCETLVIGEELLRKGVLDEMDYLIRNHEFRLRTQPYVSRKKARDILTLISPIESNPAEVLEKESRIFKKPMTLLKWFDRMQNESKGVALPYVEPLPPKRDTPQINGIAILQSDRMVGVTDAKVAQAIKLIQEDLRFGTITLKFKKELVSLRFLDSRTELIPEIERGKWRMNIKMRVWMDILQNETSLRLVNPSLFKMVKKEAEKEIHNQGIKALKQVKEEMKADIFHFGETFYQKYPTEWKKKKHHWNELFSSMETTLDIDVQLLRSGEITEPLEISEKR